MYLAALKDNPIVQDIQSIVNFLAIGVGVIVVLSVVIGGIQYMTAGDNSSAISDAKERISNALMAFIAFLFLWAFIEWLVPGGVFG